MKLTNFRAQRLFSGLTLLDRDESTKLDPEVRLAIAININRLTDHVLAFQRIGDRLANQKMAERAKANLPSMNGESLEAVKRMAEIDEEIIVLNDSTSGLENVRLKKISKSDLKLKDNAKIKGEIIAQIAPIIKDLDDGDSDED